MAFGWRLWGNVLASDRGVQLKVSPLGESIDSGNGRSIGDPVFGSLAPGRSLWHQDEVRVGQLQARPPGCRSNPWQGHADQYLTRILTQGWY